MPSRHFVAGALAGLCLLALLFCPLSAGEERGKRPNVLIITTDQQQVDVMSAAGNRWAKTPAMDSIAAQGVFFLRSYCSYPLCSPSRASLHTSRMPHEIGVDHNTLPIDAAIPLSGEVFRAAGYDTGYAGKWHLPAPYPVKKGIAGFKVLNTVPRQAQPACEIDEQAARAAIEFLQRRREQPFLLVVSLLNPHDICLVTSEFVPAFQRTWERYRPHEGAELPPLPANFVAVDEAVGSPRRDWQQSWDETRWRQYRYAYFRMLEDVDRQIGQVLDALRQTGQEENTLIVFTSDHGEGLGSHHRVGKMMFYDEEAAVPLVVSWKGVTPAGRIDRQHLVSTLDVLPTICDYAGVKPPNVVRGESLRPVIENPELPGRKCVASEMAVGKAGGSKRSFMVRTSRYKYMVFPPGVNSGSEDRLELLFDLQSDPGEMKNLAGDAAIAAEIEHHRQLLAQWNRTTEEDRYPVVPSPELRRRASR